MDTKIAKNRFKNIISQKIYTQRSLSLILLILLIILVFSFLLNNFFTFGNLSITLLALSSKVIIGIGITFILVSGLVDLSIGSTFGLCGAITAFLIIRNIPIFFAVIIGLCTGAFIGLLNGLIVEKLHVNSIIATLAMLGIVRGVVVFIAEQPIAFLPQQFTVIGQKVILGLQSPIWIMLILIVIFSPLLTKHRFFRQFYFIGGNPKAALLSGIRVSRP
jgi:ribose transport system permease protein